MITRNKDRAIGRNTSAKKSSSTTVLENDSAFRANPSILQKKKLWSAVALQQELTKSVLKQPRRSHNRDKLSLVQKLGLAEMPEPPLTKEEWERVERQAIVRQTVRDPCSICMEVLGLEEQVILNCSHIFHHACLTSFEKFTRQQTDNILSCPMCRKEEYQKKLTTEGRKAFLNRSATIIQKVWRGFQVRKQYRKALLAKNPAKKMQYYVRKIGDLSDKLVRFQHTQDRNIEAVLANTDYNIRKARLSFLTDEDWVIIIQKARERCQSNCPICMTALVRDTNYSSTTTCIITSCGHHFHSQCISSFEAFNPFDKIMCPICRSPYVKREDPRF